MDCIASTSKKPTRRNNFNFPFIKFFRDCTPAGLDCKLLNPNHFQAGNARQLPA